MNGTISSGAPKNLSSLKVRINKVYKPLPRSKQEEFIADIKFAVTESRLSSKSIKSLVPSILALGMASSTIGIMVNSLKKAGVIKRSYYKRNKRYWRKKK